MSLVYLPCRSIKKFSFTSADQCQPHLCLPWTGPNTVLYCHLWKLAIHSTATALRLLKVLLFCILRCVFHYELSLPAFSFLDCNPSFSLEEERCQKIQWVDICCFAHSALLAGVLTVFFMLSSTPTISHPRSLSFQIQCGVQCNLITK